MKTPILLTRLAGTAARIGLLTTGAMLALAFSSPVSSATSVKGKFTYVDGHGRMRNPKGDEVRYYGTNYTVPFAHAYRALDALGVDHKKAIDRDVYHMKRLGLNAFRMHLWDVEISDSVGNLLDNEHLDLLDYLIGRMEENGIDIILTAQTNFGNGYPEKNVDTGGYSYDYDKCKIHEDPASIAAQRNYIKQLVEHRNPYTGLTYAADPRIIAMEVNNEPCHTSSPAQVTAYINSMVEAMRNGGWKKPILYNVSHNGDMVQGYYDADIQGTTYQWYPIGLVAGHERKGNFLPYVDRYDIPFSNINGFNNKAKIVYEFDPADMLESYLFPAVARTFASEGFQWATQFAYDPIDMARFNTEYQTHYLNLAYTPQKAIGMKIAAKVMQATPYDGPSAKRSVYPADTVFGNATVSYRRNLSVWNAPEEFFYTNNVADVPVNAKKLKHIAGYGTSAIVEYQGRGAYFLDEINPGGWRLEVMPDVLYSSDPFEKPSLHREPAHIINACHPMRVSLPQLSEKFFYRPISDSAEVRKAADGVMDVCPGVYVLSDSESALSQISSSTPVDGIRAGDFVMPPVTTVAPHVSHKAAVSHYKSEPLVIEAEAFGDVMPDSLVIYPSDVSFWRDDNKLYTMHKVAPYLFRAEIPADDLSWRYMFNYRIVFPEAIAADATALAKTDKSDMTFPGALEGNPLDWGSADGAYYSTKLLDKNAPIILLNGPDGLDGVDVGTIPDHWGRSRVGLAQLSPLGNDAVEVVVAPGTDNVNTVLSKYVRPIIAPLAASMNPSELRIKTGKIENMSDVIVAVADVDGFTYSAPVRLPSDSEVVVPFKDFKLSPTLLVPAPFPTFLGREFVPEDNGQTLRAADIEKLQLVFPAENSDRQASAEVVGVWLQ